MKYEILSIILAIFIYSFYILDLFYNWLSGFSNILFLGVLVLITIYFAITSLNNKQTKTGYFSLYLIIIIVLLKIITSLDGRTALFLLSIFFEITLLPLQYLNTIPLLIIYFYF